MKKILAIGAHFDDVEIGVGGTLIKHITAGDEVYICVLYADEFRTGDPEIRLSEQLNSLKYLKLIKNNLMFFYSYDDDADIIKVLDILKPDIIYTSYENDTHKDHRRCSKIGQSVGRKSYITTLFYGGGSVKHFLPNVFINVNEEEKKSLLSIYISQIKCDAINIDRIIKRERYWGTMISEKPDSYAEGFIVRKMEIII